MPRERGEDRVDVLVDIVGVRRDAQVPVALGGDDPVLGERADERRCVGRADADERPAPLGVAWRRHRASELVDAGDQPLVERRHVGAGLGDPDLPDQLDAGDARRRSPGSAASPTRSGARSATGSSRGCPSRRCSGRRTSRSGSGAATPTRPSRHQRKPRPGRCEQVLERTGAEEVDPELADVDRIAPDRLVGVEQDEGAAGVRELDDLLDRRAARRCGSRRP